MEGMNAKFTGGRTWRVGGVWDGVGEHLLGHIRRSRWRGRSDEPTSPSSLVLPSPTRLVVTEFRLYRTL